MGCEFPCAHACQVLPVEGQFVNFNELSADSGVEKKALALPPRFLLVRAADTGHVLHSFITLSGSLMRCLPSLKVHAHLSKARLWQFAVLCP